MKKWINRLVYVVVLLILIGCTKQPNVKENTSSDVKLNDGVAVETKAEYSEPNFIFAEIDDAVKLLAKEDDYTSKLSKFDYKAKFKVDKILTESERAEYYKNAVIEYNDESKEKLENAISKILKKIEPYELNLPEKIFLINTNGFIEGGAAYTRANAIIMPGAYVEYMNEAELESILSHELFHVYSRHNIDKRESIYSIIHYQKCSDLEIPKELKDFTIGNPDAPDMNYYINSLLDGKVSSWIPIIYSKEEYDLEADETFFKYLNDDMIAVEIINGRAVPILKEGSPIIVKKEELEDYYSLIGGNTDYTYHPEETMADNFVLMINDKDDEVKSPWVLKEMRSMIKGFSDIEEK